MRNHEFQKVAENSWEKLSHILQKTLKYVEDEQYCRHHEGPFRTGSQSTAIKVFNTLEAKGAGAGESAGWGRIILPRNLEQ